MLREVYIITTMSEDTRVLNNEKEVKEEIFDILKENYDIYELIEMMNNYGDEITLREGMYKIPNDEEE